MAYRLMPVAAAFMKERSPIDACAATITRFFSRHNRFVTRESADLSIHLEKVLQAPVERVFAACVEPARLAEWWGPAHFTTPGLELDVRNGGRYRITMQPPAGDAFHLRGEFREVDPPRRLVYTFVWEEPVPDDQETLVTLSFLGREPTKLVVDQGPFATEARRALHEAGWTESLERLEESLVGDRRDR